MEFKNNDELRKAVKDGVLDCKGEGLVCLFNIDIYADIINARDINAMDIDAWNIDARDIDARDIDARDIDARDIDAWNIDALNIDAWNINAMDIDARDIDAMDIDAMDIDAWNIDAMDINAWNIDAENINAENINAENIDAWDISYFAVCTAYNNITCTSIKGQRKNSKHFALDGKITIKKEPNSRKQRKSADSMTPQKKKSSKKPRKPGPKGPHKTRERREELRTFLQEYGYWNMNITAYAKKWKTSHDVIRNDIRVVLDQIDVIDKEPIQFEVARGRKKVFKDALKHINNTTLSMTERARWAEVLLRCSNDINRFLEDHGLGDAGTDHYQEAVDDYLKGTPKALVAVKRRLKDNEHQV